MSVNPAPTPVTPAPYTPSPDNPQNVADLFAVNAAAETAMGYLQSLDGVDPPLKAQLLASIQADVAAIDDQIAMAIEADSAAKGTPIPEVVAEPLASGSYSLYTYNPNGGPGQKLTLINPVPAQNIPLVQPTPAPPIPTPAPAPTPAPTP